VDTVTYTCSYGLLRCAGGKRRVFVPARQGFGEKASASGHLCCTMLRTPPRQLAQCH
jgi:hypothetical protein